MYAVIHTGGKQYRVEPGSRIKVEQIKSTPGDKLEIAAVSLVRKDDGELLLGAPWVEGARVIATVLRQELGQKIRIFKKKKRKQYRRTTGHRQHLTALHIEEIEAGH